MPADTQLAGGCSDLQCNARAAAVTPCRAVSTGVLLRLTYTPALMTPAAHLLLLLALKMTMGGAPCTSSVVLLPT
jgi:hypothetical protein